MPGGFTPVFRLFCRWILGTISKASPEVDVARLPSRPGSFSRLVRLPMIAAPRLGVVFRALVLPTVLGLVAELSLPEFAQAAAPEFGASSVAFLNKYCVKCHGADMPKAGLSLHTFKDAATVLKGRKRWETVLDMIESGEMPPQKSPRPTADEQAAFVKSVRSIFEHADNTGVVDPGQVTIRRLNRTEYNNTVRDLLLADFAPAEDFPADDVGYGFDNIGDVLTVSPVLMERYLAAAETLAERVILVDIPKPSKRYLAGRFLQPNNAQTPQGRFRPLDATAKEPQVSGPFAAPGDYLKFSADGDLFFRATLYAETKSQTPVRVALFVSGPGLPEYSSDAEIEPFLGTALPQMKPLKILGTFEITARDAKKPQTIEVPVNRLGRISRAGIALLKPTDGSEPAKLHIEHLWSEGPLDTRPLSHQMLLAGDESKPTEQRTREVLQRLVTRAYRRPATKDEVEAVARFADRAVADGQKWEAGMRLAITALLCSPKFLFRVELDDRPQSAQPHAIDEFQLASRLSYFLWSSMPDDELFDLAKAGKLSANLDAQVRRMLKDPKAAALVDNFAMQWLQLGKLQTLAPDAQLFPAYNEKLRQAMMTETKLFLQEIVREDRSVLDMIQADYTFVNEQLAKHYGIADTLGNRVGDKPKQRGQPIRGPNFVKVPLPPDGDRGGLLTQASVLTVTSNPTRTSPVKRGRWVLEQILGTPPPPPPPNVPELEQQKEQLTGSLRQRMEQHRQNPACANCHARMDPIGFAFENFDAIGSFRKKDGEFEIDPSGTLPDGRNFQGPNDLKQILLAKKELFARSLAEKMLTYAVGRGIEYYDKRALDGIVAAVAKDDYHFSRLVIAIAQSDPFRKRRGKDQNP